MHFDSLFGHIVSLHEMNNHDDILDISFSNLWFGYLILVPFPLSFG